MQGAAASQALVRVETPSNVSQFASLVDRQVVTVGVLPVQKAGRTCAADSAAAALTTAIGDANWEATSDATDPASPLLITRIKNERLPSPSATPWSWVTFVDQHYVPDPCTAPVPDGSEVLVFPSCTTVHTGSQASCFTGGPLYIKVSGGTPYPTQPSAVGGNRTFVSIGVIEDVFNRDTGATTIGPSTDSAVSTDEGGPPATSNDPERLGIAFVRFTEWGNHAIRATENGKVPGRANVCATDGQDGFCGTSKPDFNTFVVEQFPSTCATNGHDGFCGTTDTSGPVTHVTNIKQKQRFKKKKGPGRLAGTIDVDPNGVKDVKLRLTRFTTTRVAIKAKKKTTRSKSKAKKSAVTAKAKRKTKTRYKTVKRCTAWDDGTALLEPAKCGTKYGKWFTAELSDLRNAFTYNFAMTLPAGSYVLEVLATDENGAKDVTALGRNVLTFTVL